MTTEGADKAKQVTLIQQQAQQVTLIHLRSATCLHDGKRLLFGKQTPDRKPLLFGKQWYASDVDTPLLTFSY